MDLFSLRADLTWTLGNVSCIRSQLQWESVGVYDFSNVRDGRLFWNKY